MNEFVLSQILSFVINIASGVTTETYFEYRRRKLEDALRSNEDCSSIKEQLLQIGLNAQKLLTELEIKDEEKSLFLLLENKSFRDNLEDWIIMPSLFDSIKAKENLETTLLNTLSKMVGEREAPSIVQRFFNIIENEIFRDQKFSNWRSHLNDQNILKNLSKISDNNNKILRHLTKQFTSDELFEAYKKYIEVLLKTCNIIDLQELPEGDAQIATRNFTLRELYIPLRLKIDTTSKNSSESDLELIENFRTYERFLSSEKYEKAETFEENLSLQERRRESLGKILQSTHRLVMLGDPGSGKTTLVRWLITAYLLKQNQREYFEHFPDTENLPDINVFPVLIRCRKLIQDGVPRAFDEIFRHTVQLLGLSKYAEQIMALLEQSLTNGSALIIIDGLDEITDSKLRAKFSEQLQDFASANEKTSIIVTSRIVGYRTMKFKLGRGFYHSSITDLTDTEKFDFSKRWCEATKPELEWDEAADDLIESIRSSDRIQRLTGNPMLLTTLALLKRNLPRLPRRREQLYFECVKLLLNFRSYVDDPIEQREAFPQLEYIAYSMCKSGVQYLRQDEILTLLENIRQEYSQQEILKRSSVDFLETLEKRSSLLIQSGFVLYNSQEIPCYEFRHLTIQEYMAGLALIDGFYPDYVKRSRLEDRILPLISNNDDSKDFKPINLDVWLEVLRLCIASAKAEDADYALLAIIKSDEIISSNEVLRERAVLAAYCLSDEPNISQETAVEVIKFLISAVGLEEGRKSTPTTTVDKASAELGRSKWGELFQELLLDEFANSVNSVETNTTICGNYATLFTYSFDFLIPKSEDYSTWIENLLNQISTFDNNQSPKVFILLMNELFWDRLEPSESLLNSLIKALESNYKAVVAASAWGIYWLLNKFPNEGDKKWKISKNRLIEIINFINKNESNNFAVYYCIWSIYDSFDKEDEDIMYNWAKALDDGALYELSFDSYRENFPQIVETLQRMLKHNNSRINAAAAATLAKLGNRDESLIKPLFYYVDNIYSYEDVRHSCIEYLGLIGTDKVVEELAFRIEINDDWLYSRVIVTLAGTKNHKVTDYILPKLYNNDPNIRQNICELLGVYKNTKAVEPLKVLLENETDDNVIKAAQKALASLE